MSAKASLDQDGAQHQRGAGRCYIKRPLIGRILTRTLHGLLALVFAAVLASCGAPFKVQPPIDLLVQPNAQAQMGDLTIQAAAVTDENLLYDTFDANLIMAGILPVQVVVRNAGQRQFDLKKIKFEIKTTSGSKAKAIDARDAFKRLISFYEITSYNKHGYKRSLEDFASYALDRSTPLAPGKSRQGLIFFSIPDEMVRRRGIMLVVHEDNDSIELKVN
jgi:hypothetical protein